MSVQLVMPFLPAASYAPEDFIAGEANAAALALMERWPDWPYSMVLLTGEAGSGKTHLAHVFAQRARASFLPPERVGEVPAEMLLTGSHSWVIDGIEAVADEAALAQLINHARARGDYVLMTARAPASALPIRLPDLASRLKALPALTLAQPDDALLIAVLAKQFSDRQLRVAPELLTYALTHLERGFAAMARFVATLDDLSLARHRAITLALVREALAPKTI